MARGLYKRISERQFDAAANEDPEFVLKLAAYARQELYLRDIPQVLLVLAANDDRFKDDEYTLPIFASIRNLRNMLEAGVPEDTVVRYSEGCRSWFA